MVVILVAILKNTLFDNVPSIIKCGTTLNVATTQSKLEAYEEVIGKMVVILVAILKNTLFDNVPSIKTTLNV